MSAKLAAIAGPLRGSSFTLAALGLSIGRDLGNGITVPDRALSRRHCELKPAGEGWTVVDLESRNGTFVNGIPVKERTLASGDQIQAGDSLFVYDDGVPAALSPPGVVLDDEAQGADSTVQISPGGALYLSRERIAADARVPARLARDLALLIRIATELPAASDGPSLARSLFESLHEVVPAERGALLVAENGEPVPVAAWDFRDGGATGVRVNRSVARRVLAEGVSVLLSGIPTASSSESLVASRTTSVMAVPLRVHERVTGVLMLETSDPRSAFDESQLQLVTAVGAIAAVSLEAVERLSRLAGENRHLADALALEHELVGESARLKEVLRLVARAAPSASTVLIRGESGTGKELVARAIHRNSPRARGPFVAINGAALTESLLESELFGHEAGAFTGAIGLKKGRLEVASGGTVFIDEVGELGPGIQAKLLRVLQERTFERVGGTRSFPLDIRLVAATNKDLEAAVASGAFRSDLYYRLNVVSIPLPPLRERKDDIPLLTAYFVSKLARGLNRKIHGVSDKTRRYLLAYDWPGNVRELENAIERAAVLGAGEWIEPEDLPEALLERPEADGAEGASKYHAALADAKRRLIRDALAEKSGNVTEAARLLGLHPNYLHRLMTNLDLREGTAARRP